MSLPIRAAGGQQPSTAGPAQPLAGPQALLATDATRVAMLTSAWGAGAHLVDILRYRNGLQLVVCSDLAELVKFLDRFFFSAVIVDVDWRGRSGRAFDPVDILTILPELVRRGRPVIELIPNASSVDSLLRAIEGRERFPRASAGDPWSGVVADIETIEELPEALEGIRHDGVYSGVLDRQHRVFGSLHPLLEQANHWPRDLLAAAHAGATTPSAAAARLHYETQSVKNRVGEVARELRRLVALPDAPPYVALVILACQLPLWLPAWIGRHRFLFEPSLLMTLFPGDFGR